MLFYKYFLSFQQPVTRARFLTLNIFNAGANPDQLRRSPYKGTHPCRHPKTTVPHRGMNKAPSLALRVQAQHLQHLTMQAGGHPDPLYARGRGRPSGLPSVFQEEGKTAVAPDSFGWGKGRGQPFPGPWRDFPGTPDPIPPTARLKRARRPFKGQLQNSENKAR